MFLGAHACDEEGVERRAAGLAGAPARPGRRGSEPPYGRSTQAGRTAVPGPGPAAGPLYYDLQVCQLQFCFYQ